MEIVVTRTQERLKSLEDVLEKTRVELADAHGTSKHLEARLEIARENLASYVEACKKLESSTCQELQRSAELQLELENIIKRYNLLDEQEKNRTVSGNGEDSSLFNVVTSAFTEKVSCSTSSRDLISTHDRSTCTRDFQSEGGHDRSAGNALLDTTQVQKIFPIAPRSRGEISRDKSGNNLPSTSLRRPLQVETTRRKRNSPCMSDQPRRKQYRMKAKGDHINYSSIATHSPRHVLSFSEPRSMDELITVGWEADNGKLDNRESGQAEFENDHQESSSRNFYPDYRQRREYKIPGAVENNHGQESTSKSFSADPELRQKNHQEGREGSLVAAIQTVPLSSLNSENLTRDKRLYNDSAAPLKEATLLEPNLLAISASATALLVSSSVLKQGKDGDDNITSILPRDSPVRMSTFCERTGSGCDGPGAAVTEPDVRCGDESCVSVATYSHQVEPSERQPEPQTRSSSPNLDFDVENLLKQDLFPDLVLSSDKREDTEWVFTFTDTEPVTFLENLRDQELPAKSIMDSCPDSQEMIERRRLAGASEASRLTNMESSK
ncbi:hypothetical protein R1flu_025707 [Riccia fluitans]|uniref:Uncharacterized protein n=1 Tax=Riccia fluitans TaxID=41844 RepID=A0ABD1XYH5_9MARC